MAAKDVKGKMISAGSTWVNTNCSSVEFRGGWVVLVFGDTNRREFYSHNDPHLEKFEITPEGVAYPGDGVAGPGPKKVTMSVIWSVPDIVITGVDNVEVDEGWVVITRGDWIIAVSPNACDALFVEPS